MAQQERAGEKRLHTGRLAAISARATQGDAVLTQHPLGEAQVPLTRRAPSPEGGPLATRADAYGAKRTRATIDHGYF